MEEEKSYQEIRKELIDKYKTTVIPKLILFEEERKFILKKIRFIKTIFFIIFITGSILITKLLFIDIKYLILIFFLALYSWIICGIWICEISGKFKDKICNIIIPAICDCFPNLKWELKQKFVDKSIYEKSNLLREIKCIFCHNHLEGTYKNVNYIIEDLEIWEKNYKFYGYVIKFKMNKKFKGNTVIHPDFIRYKYDLSNMHVTELEDIVFEKQYKVFTDDDVEARYLITPSLIERVNLLKNKFEADYIYLSFYEETLYIALRSKKELFKTISINKPIYDNNQYYNHTLLEEIISILKLIDYFKLDQNIGM